MKLNTIHIGNSLDVLKTIEDNVIDSIITDPPYGLTSITKRFGKKDSAPAKYGSDGAFQRTTKGFMGQEWDGSGIELNVELWAECLRVAKPGATLMAFGGTRTWHRIAVAIEDAGWEIIDSIAWHYGCLSEDTEILTSNGWEHYHKNIDKSQIVCYDIEKDSFEIHLPERKFFYENKYPAYRIKSDTTDQIVSKDHRVIVEREGELIFQRAETLESEICVPILENLSKVQKVVSNLQCDSSTEKQILFADMPPKTGREKEKENIKYNLRNLWKKVFQTAVLEKKNKSPLLQSTLCRKSKALDKRHRPSWKTWLDRRIKEILQEKHVWKEQPSMEGWGYVFQTQRKLSKSANKVCEMPSRIYKHVTQRWLRNGTQVISGNGIKQAAFENGSGSSHKSQRRRQRDRKSNVIQKQFGSQKVRARSSYTTTMATVEEIDYVGNVWCVQVPTGSFVARRNGNIFITGNSGFPKSYDISKGIDKKLGVERKSNGTKQIDVGMQSGNMHANRKSEIKEVPNDVATSEEAQLWNGWKTALKPSFEPIIVAKKPLDDTNVNNALKWGVAGFNIDGGRVGEQERYPANTILGCYCDSDTHNNDCPVRIMDEQSGYKKGSGISYDYTDEKEYDVDGFIKNIKPNSPSNRGDSGGASRFFYTAKASKAERNAGLENLVAKQKIYNGKSNNSSKDIKDVEARFTTQPQQNFHPTVKPLKLMEYLCTLTKTPTGGIVLDPFTGSGTTLLAARNVGRDFIGIELNEEYANIALARLNGTDTGIF